MPEKKREILPKKEALKAEKSFNEFFEMTKFKDICDQYLELKNESNFELAQKLLDDIQKGVPVPLAVKRNTLERSYEERRAENISSFVNLVGAEKYLKVKSILKKFEADDYVDELLELLTNSLEGQASGEIYASLLESSKMKFASSSGLTAFGYEENPELQKEIAILTENVQDHKDAITFSMNAVEDIRAAIGYRLNARTEPDDVKAEYLEIKHKRLIDGFKELKDLQTQHIVKINRSHIDGVRRTLESLAPKKARPPAS